MVSSDERGTNEFWKTQDIDCKELEKKVNDAVKIDCPIYFESIELNNCKYIQKVAENKLSRLENQFDVIIFLLAFGASISLTFIRIDDLVARIGYVVGFVTVLGVAFMAIRILKRINRCSRIILEAEKRILFEPVAAPKPPQENLPEKKVSKIGDHKHKVKERLSEKLDEIKKEKCYENRFQKLEELCIDENILNDALEIAKQQSNLNLPGATLIIAITALVLNFLPDAISRLVLLAIGFISVWRLVIIEFEKWTIICYDLIELRQMKRGKW